MGERGHTKGPWRVKRTDTTYYVESAEGVRVLSTSWHGHIRKPYPLKGEAFANANLAAAAPDLVEAAKDVIASRSSTYKARNGRSVGIQDDSGEMVWLVPFGQMALLEAALSKATPTGEASDV
ncbi:hypothetical protein IED13_01165 [Bosea sp. SSUT16]|uniref:Uncharacterized protein n=1 Tax=Bosea spartocytisi TaxID=2773451 RepID=A0A927HXK1_9HYPH|nr:hypothetical protein [Bosea spartocytisi]MBD3844289.1 hypothetical protein [Bosea spartocytisi]MCT4470605.1 hypothetical protein [Bosea spartocytisi]